MKEGNISVVRNILIEIVKHVTLQPIISIVPFFQAVESLRVLFCRFTLKSCISTFNYQNNIFAICLVAFVLRVLIQLQRIYTCIKCI